MKKTLQLYLFNCICSQLPLCGVFAATPTAHLAQFFDGVSLSAAALSLKPVLSNQYAIKTAVKGAAEPNATKKGLSLFDGSWV